MFSFNRNMTSVIRSIRLRPNAPLFDEVIYLPLTPAVDNTNRLQHCRGCLMSNPNTHRNTIYCTEISRPGSSVFHGNFHKPITLLFIMFNPSVGIFCD